MTPTTEIRIALADDHAILRKGLAELINSMEGFTIVLDADNGRELLDKLKTTDPKPDAGNERL
jgi:two-component system invasion response regulator UvrY